MSTRNSVHVTRDLLTVLLEHAETRDPMETNVELSATPAGEFDTDLGIDPDTPVLTHFTLPNVGGSVSAVFGVNIGTPGERGRARFVSHPDGTDVLTKTDDLAAVVFVAVPPWEIEQVSAYDRGGDPIEIVVVDAEPPVETVPE